MAKSKGGKKKSKGKRPKGTTSKVDVCGASSSSVDNLNDTQLIWSAADECEHYAALGCHIANIARCKSDESSKPLRHKSHFTQSSSSYTCSEYRQMYQTAMQQYPWLLDIERFDPSDYHPEDIEHIPDVAMNDGDEEDEQMILTLTNIKNTVNICYVTVYDVDLWDANGNTLTSGVNSTTSISTENNAGEEEGKLSTSVTTNNMKCTTFIILCPPQTFVHLCSLAPNQTLQPSSTTENKILITSWSQIDIESDIQPWSFHPNMEDEHPYLLHFPFYGVDNQKEVSEDNNSTTTTTSTAYQCTQSEDGQLTHFFHGNHHAIDFACPIGTPLYSPANGVVVQVRDNNDGNGKEVSGISASNMFQWNSIMIQVEDDDLDSTTDPLYVEYVHIQSKSCVVQTGDIVQKGQLICRSGSVGFSPEPHLHLAAYRRNGNDASTVRVRFESIGNSSDRSFLPRTGGWYNQSGLIPNHCISSVDK